MVRPRLSTALAAPWTRPCSWPRAARLTRLDIVGCPNPMPSASGTRATANIATEWVNVAATRPTAAHSRPSMKVVLSPIRLTIGRISAACTIAPRTPNPAKKYPVCGASKLNRRDANSANVVWNTANANQ